MLVVRLGLASLVNAYFLQFFLRRSMLFLLNFWDMAKLVRRLTLNQVSAGSSPAIPIKMNDEKISPLNVREIFCFVGVFPVFEKNHFASRLRTEAVENDAG